MEMLTIWGFAVDPLRVVLLLLMGFAVFRRCRMGLPGSRIISTLVCCWA